MKFRFCGEGDCPDWLLAEINTLSRLSSVKLKTLGVLVTDYIVQPPLELDKAEKIFSNTKLDKDVDLKSCVACLTFILMSAASYDCDAGVLSSELQQLGLPREHSQVLRRLYTDSRGTLSAKLASRSLRVNKLEETSAAGSTDSKSVSLKLHVDGTDSQVSVVVEMAELLLAELCTVRDVVNEVNNIGDVI